MVAGNIQGIEFLGHWQRGIKKNNWNQHIWNQLSNYSIVSVVTPTLCWMTLQDQGRIITLDLVFLGRDPYTHECVHSIIVNPITFLTSLKYYLHYYVCLMVVLQPWHSEIVAGACLIWTDKDSCSFTIYTATRKRKWRMQHLKIWVVEWSDQGTISWRYQCLCYGWKLKLTMFDKGNWSWNTLGYAHRQMKTTWMIEYILLAFRIIPHHDIMKKSYRRPY